MIQDGNNSNNFDKNQPPKREVTGVFGDSSLSNGQDKNEKITSFLHDTINMTTNN